MNSEIPRLPNFSRIYVEEDIQDTPLAQSLLKKFKRSQWIPISHYKEVFNRPLQNRHLQSQSRALILARRKINFLYDGSRFCPDFGHRRFFYNTIILNCPYSCSYCYLQGMYPSAHLVIFANHGDFIEAVKEELKNGPLYLCISYDTDLLALEGIFGFCREWINLAYDHPELTIELRTKSAGFKLISDLPPPPNFILAWSLSPTVIAKKYEHSTASITGRLRSMTLASKLGWHVRLCIDPILKVPDWKQHYSELVDLIEDSFSSLELNEASIGTFRISKNYLRNLRKQELPFDLLYHPFEIKNGTAGYPPDERKELLEVVKNLLTKVLPPDKISVWT